MILRINVSILRGINNILFVETLTSYKDGKDGLNGFNDNMNV